MSCYRRLLNISHKTMSPIRTFAETKRKLRWFGYISSSGIAIRKVKRRGGKTILRTLLGQLKIYKTRLKGIVVKSSVVPQQLRKLMA